MLNWYLLYMDQRDETITFKAFVEMIWRDENIGWNASEFGGTSSIEIPFSLLWTPDIAVTSGLNVEYAVPVEQRIISVQNDGTVRSSTYCLITNICPLSIKDFPFDEQTCIVTFGSIMHSTDRIDLVIGEKMENLNRYYRGNGEWNLVSFDKELDKFNWSDGYQYVEAVYTVKVRRQPIYYICVMVIPTFVTATICLFGLFVPAMNTGERVEKVNMGLATLLSMAVILGIVAGEMPKTKKLPLLANELDVYEAITANYNKNVRPAGKNGGPVVVSVELTYFNFLYMDQHQETITFMTTVNMIWIDENLIWNASEFGGTSSVVIPYSLLWKPDILVTSGLSIDNINPDEQRYVSVQSDGTVDLYSLCVIINTCRMSIEDFPYDIQKCNITFESWMYRADQVNLVVGKKRENINATINEDYYLGNGEWTLVSFKKEPYSYIASDGQPYAIVTYVVELRRQPIYYICVLLIPTFVTATICLFGLFVPAMNTGERVEKVNMGLATLLSMAVILGIVAGEMPKTTTLPLLGFYVLAELLLCTIGVFLSMVIMIAHQRASTRALIPPRWLNAVLLLEIISTEKPEKTDDQIQETITFMTTVDMIWKDENLIWNASEFNGTSSIVLPYYLLWKPDVFVSSGLNFEYMLPDEQRFLKVMSDGTVELLSLCSITNTCRMSIEAFPYDIQTCNITLESWIYTADQVDLVVGKKRGNMNATINDGNFLGNGEWTLVSFDREPYSYIASDGLPYASVTYTATLRRQPIYYICVLLIPTFVTATICLFGLFVPAMNTGERVEKVNMGLTALLSMAVLLGIVAGEMPKTTTLPLLGFYVLAELLLCTTGVIVSMMIIVAHQRMSTRARIPPRWLIKILLLKMETIQKLEKREGTKIYPKKVIQQLSKDKKMSDRSETIKNPICAERLNQVLDRVEEYVDDKEFKEFIILQWIIIFDRIDMFFLIVFNTVNVVMSLILFK
uniref:Uncharacterized protein n=1 Tax=Plectus sambesii TaxID=2011161 RepID=A0A914WEC6_9BILA